MHRRTSHDNRIGLALTGLLLMIAGAALFAAHQGYLGHVQGTAIYPPPARGFVHRNQSWLWPVLAAVAVLVGLLFLRWLLVQVRTDRLRRLVVDQADRMRSAASADVPTGPTDTDVDLAPDGIAGRTGMPADAFTDMIEDDLVELRGVRSAYAALSGHVDSPQLWLRITADADADVGQIRERVVGQVLADARTSLDLPRLPTYIRITVAKRSGARQVD